MSEFITAVKQGDRDAVERLLGTDPSLVSAKDENGVSAILLSHYYGQDAVAQALLARRPTLDVFEAATVGDEGRLRALIDRDPSLVNAWSTDGFFPLGLAAFFKRPAAVTLLLERGADARMASKPAGFTPLHSAVADDAGAVTKDLVRMLIEAGGDPNARSASGSTPLHSVAFTGDVAVLEMLLAAGGDATIADEKGRTPLDIARDQKNSEAAAMLHDAVVARKASAP